MVLISILTKLSSSIGSSFYTLIFYILKGVSVSSWLYAKYTYADKASLGEIDKILLDMVVETPK